MGVLGWGGNKVPFFLLRPFLFEHRNHLAGTTFAFKRVPRASKGLGGLQIGHDIIRRRFLKIGNLGTKLVTFTPKSDCE